MNALNHNPKETMKDPKTYSLAYFSCPNDTFLFKAIAHSFIDLGGICLDLSMEDVETLNQWAATGTYHITKLSFAALGTHQDRYGLIRAGADLGREYIRHHAQKMDESVIQQHIGLYVNDYSRDIGNVGEQAVIRFFETAEQAGLMEKTRFPLFAC